jgi:hypothetical protein
LEGRFLPQYEKELFSTSVQNEVAFSLLGVHTHTEWLSGKVIVERYGVVRIKSLSLRFYYFIMQCIFKKNALHISVFTLTLVFSEYS